jgi:hypothetical protein
LGLVKKEATESGEKKEIKRRRVPWGQVAARYEADDRKNYWEKRIKENSDALNDPTIKVDNG